MRALNIVAEPPGWVCGWIGQMLAQRLGCEVSPMAPADGTNIYVPYYFLREKTARDIALFTHHDNFESWERASELADVCVAMCPKTARHLPAEKTVVIPVPADPQFRRRQVVFGVSGRDYVSCGTNRKRVDWIDRLRAIPGVCIQFSGGKIPWDAMPTWYRLIDYLLVLSDNEGGPMGVVEAIASGTPVIAPDVGWAWEYPVIRYNDFDELAGIMRKLAPAPDAWDVTAQKFRALV